MVNFKITNGTDLEDKKDEFIKLYNDKNIKAEKIPEILDISIARYNTLRKRCINEGLIKSRHNFTAQKKISKVSSCIHRSTTRGLVYFRIVHKGVYFCNVKDFRIAEKIVKELIKVDWDKNELPRIKKMLGV